MATSRMSEFVQHLRRVMVQRDVAGMTDGQLLEDYISRRDEAALAALVHRHGPMVWGVCRRVLSNYHDAEDAFQATFLVLVRKAASIASRELIANWLYGVAHQTALKARATAAKHRARERQVTEMPEPTMTNEDLMRDLKGLLDEELSRLPDKYRAVLVLCDLEGKTRKQAARQLGCPEGTVAGRLARARIMLAKRLTQRGVVLSGAASVAVLAQQAMSAGVPNSVVSSTIKAASLFAAGKAVATGAISVKVAALTEGVLKAMSMTKLKTVFVLMVFACVLGSTGGVVVWQAQAEAQQTVPIDLGFPIEKPMPDLSGTWQGGGGWGTVVLRRTNEGAFEGTYTDTFGTDVGRLSVRWSSASERYEGTWNEGKYRFGRIALEPSKGGEAASGAWTTDPKCEHKPGVPSLASLRWNKSKPKSHDTIGTLGIDKVRVGEAATTRGKETGGLQGSDTKQVAFVDDSPLGQMLREAFPGSEVEKSPIRLYFHSKRLLIAAEQIIIEEGGKVKLTGCAIARFQAPKESDKASRPTTMRCKFARIKLDRPAAYLTPHLMRRNLDSIELSGGVHLTFEE